MVSIQDTISDPTELCCGVPQGSVLGPILFLLYTQPLMSFLTIHFLACCMLMTDRYINPDLASAILCVEKCVSDVKT